MPRILNFFEWPDVSLADALHDALVAEGAGRLQSELFVRTSDVDLAAEDGLLVDASSGGSLIQADLKGLLSVNLKLLAPCEGESLWWMRK
ncbi:MAG: hypothetical protein AAGF94_20005 [Pseudomonadota bacterium]